MQEASEFFVSYYRIMIPPCAFTWTYTDRGLRMILFDVRTRPGGALGYFLGGYVPPGTPNWHPVLKKNSPKIDTPF